MLPSSHTVAQESRRLWRTSSGGGSRSRFCFQVQPLLLLLRVYHGVVSCRPLHLGLARGTSPVLVRGEFRLERSPSELRSSIDAHPVPNETFGTGCSQTERSGVIGVRFTFLVHSSFPIRVQLLHPARARCPSTFMSILMTCSTLDLCSQTKRFIRGDNRPISKTKKFGPAP